MGSAAELHQPAISITNITHPLLTTNTLASPARAASSGKSECKGMQRQRSVVRAGRRKAGRDLMMMGVMNWLMAAVVSGRIRRCQPTGYLATLLGTTTSTHAQLPTTTPPTSTPPPYLNSDC